MLLTLVPPRGYYGGMKTAQKNKLIQRLKIIEGQVRGVQNMVEKDAYCIDVITQSSAIKQAISNIEDVLLENHLSTCVVDQIRNGKDKQSAKEILKVYKLKRK